MWRRIAAVAAVCVAALGVCEIGARLYLRMTNRHPGLLWPPRSEIAHHTSEFDYVARINNLGFRDRDFAIGRRREGTRILVVGDSFTYGWGVPVEEAWVKLLEREMNVETANLGSPGSAPAQYADVAARAVPLLRPDFIVVAVLQADDLLQCSIESSTPRSRAVRLREGAARFVPGLLNLFALASIRPLKVTREDFQAIWKKQMDGFLPQLTAGEKTRFAELPPEAQAMYRAGQLNPGLLFYSLRHASFLVDALAPEPAPVARLASHLARIRKLGRTVLVSVPHRAYAGAHDLETMRALGFTTTPDMLHSLEPDRAIFRAASLAGVEFISVTEAFHREAASHPLYFKWDDHFNPAGHRVFARLLAPRLHTK